MMLADKFAMKDFIASASFGIGNLAWDSLGSIQVVSLLKWSMK